MRRYVFPLILKTVKLFTDSAVLYTVCTSIKLVHFALPATLYQLFKAS
jgi:hypothetical protein